MSARVVPMRIGDVDLLVEVVPVAGSEQTSTLDKAGQRVVDAFGRAQNAIVAVASSVVETVGRLGERAARPEHVEVEFGLKFSIQGDVVVASASGEATLRVAISYDLGHG